MTTKKDTLEIEDYEMAILYAVMGAVPARTLKEAVEKVLSLPGYNKGAADLLESASSNVNGDMYFDLFKKIDKMFS